MDSPRLWRLAWTVARRRPRVVTRPAAGLPVASPRAAPAGAPRADHLRRAGAGLRPPRPERCAGASRLLCEGRLAAPPSERAAGEVGDQLRRRGVEADDVEHARVVRVGDREAVRDHADHDQPGVDARRAGGTRAAPGPGGCRPPRSRGRCRSRTCRSPARCASAYSIGSAQSVPPNGRSRHRRDRVVQPLPRRRSRAASGRRCRPYHGRRADASQPPRAGVEADDLVLRLGRRRHQRQRRRRVARRQARHAGDRAARSSSPTRRARAAGACPSARRCSNAV